jgi:hypothetical protein
MKTITLLILLLAATLLLNGCRHHHMYRMGPHYSNIQ